MPVEELQPIRYADVDAEDIEVHWQHPRHGLEDPVLLVWPMPVRDKWAAVLTDGVAWVVCHETLFETGDGETDKLSRKVNPNNQIPRVVAEALLDYDGNYGPVETVANPYPDAGEEVEFELSEGQTQLVE